MTAQIKALTDAFAALAKRISNKENVPPEQASQTQAIPHTHSIGHATWEVTAGHTAITQLVPATTSVHALRKKMDPRACPARRTYHPEQATRTQAILCKY
jgi:hypothetical protein